jgi:hypothetical protein
MIGQQGKSATPLISAMDQEDGSGGSYRSFASRQYGLRAIKLWSGETVINADVHVFCNECPQRSGGYQQTIFTCILQCLLDACGKFGLIGQLDDLRIIVDKFVDKQLQATSSIKAGEVTV